MSIFRREVSATVELCSTRDLRVRVVVAPVEVKRFDAKGIPIVGRQIERLITPTIPKTVLELKGANVEWLDDQRINGGQRRNAHWKPPRSL